MSIEFNADEVFEIADRIEENGAAFYRKAAAIVKDSKTRLLLLDLAAMEERHRETFGELRAALSKKGWAPAFDPDGQSEMYLRAIADGRIFDVKADPAERLTGSESTGDIFRMAVALEKDSLLFYQELRQIVPERLGRDRVERIIGEEIRHVMLLNAGLAELK